MWIKIVIACIPAAIVGILFDNKINLLFYNFQLVSIAIIVFGILFIVVANYNKDKSSIAKNINQLTYKIAIIIALFTIKNDILTMNTNY